MSAVPKIPFTEAEYLALENASDAKHQFVDGEILAMSGAQLAHNYVAANLTVALGVAFRGRACVPLGSDQRVKVESTGLYTYPDLVVVCGKPEMSASDPKMSLTNPTVVVEILSESTESDDRGWKFAHYRQIASLQAYMLVDPRRRIVEIFRASPAGWVLSEARGAGASIVVPGIDVTLALDEVFAGLDALETGS